MFDVLSEDYQRVWLIAFLVVWALLLFGGFVIGKLNAVHTHRIPTWARMGSSLTLVIAAWSWFVFSAGRAEPFPLLVALGMTLGCLGDFFMARLMPVKDYVIGGILSFAVCHIAYVAAIVLFSSQNGVGINWFVVGIWWIVGLVGWYIAVFRGQKATFLHYMALPYALLLASTAGFAFNLALSSSGFFSLAIGTFLFLISDLLLAAQLFRGFHFDLIGDVVWLLYGPAQMLIVYSVSAALQFVS